MVGIRAGLGLTDASSLVFEDHRRESSLRAALQLPGEQLLTFSKRDDHTGYREMDLSSRHTLIRPLVPGRRSIGHPVDVRCVCHGHRSQRERSLVERWVGLGFVT